MKHPQPHNTLFIQHDKISYDSVNPGSAFFLLRSVGIFAGGVGQVVYLRPEVHQSGRHVPQIHSDTGSLTVTFLARLAHGYVCVLEEGTYENILYYIVFP